MYLYTASVLCRAFAVVALDITIGRNVRRYRAGVLSRRAYMRDCLSNAGIALVASYFVLTRLSVLVAPAKLAAIIGMIGLAAFLTGVGCVAVGFGLLVRENRQRRV